MGHFAGGDLTDTPMADAGSVTGAASRYFPFPYEPRPGGPSFQYSFSTLDASFEQFGAALGQALETAQGDGTDKRASRAGRRSEPSVAFCYPGEISSSSRPRGCMGHRSGYAEPLVILAGDGLYVTLYLVGEGLFSCQTQMRAESLEQLLRKRCTPDEASSPLKTRSPALYTLAPRQACFPGRRPPSMRPQRQIPATRAFRTRLPRALASTPTATRATPTTRATRPIRKPATPFPSPPQAKLTLPRRWAGHALSRRVW